MRPLHLLVAGVVLLALALLAVFLGQPMGRSQATDGLPATASHGRPDPVEPDSLLAGSDRTRRSVGPEHSKAQPKEPITASDGSHRFLILDHDDRPVQECRLVLVEGNTVLETGRSDVDGLVEISLPDRLKGSYVYARKPGLISDRVYVDYLQEDPTVLRVLSEGVIHGIVVYGDGTPVPAGFTVLAWDSIVRYPTQEIMRRALAGDETLPMAGTEADGTFLLDGLIPQTRYVLAVGGQGYITRDLVQAQASGRSSEQIKITVDKAYGVRVLLVRSDGGSTTSTGMRITIREAWPSGQATPLPSWILPLTGVPLSSLDAPTVLSLLAYAAQGDPPVVGPLKYTAILPGYHRVDSDVFAYPVVDGIEEVTVIVEAISPCFGKLSVRVSGEWAEDPWGHNRRSAPAILELSEPGRNSIAYELRTIARGEYALEGVPCGTYQARVASQSCSYVRTIETPVVVSETGGRLEVDIGEIGRIRVDFLTSDGGEYLGPAVIGIGEGTSSVDGGAGLRGWKELDFDRGPYQIVGLSPGAYSVGCRFPQATRLSHSGSVEVTPGGEANVQFVLR